MNYNFDSDVAKEYGVNEAIMIANFQFWIAKNKANGKNYHNGRYWTYNSIKALKELFPFWSEQNIKTILRRLKEKGVLMCENLNTNRYDQTMWYAFVNDNQWIGENQPIDKLELTNGFVRTNQPIPDNKPDILPDNKPDNNIHSVSLEEKEQKKRFKKPTLEEIEDYIHEKGLSVNGEKFFNYFNEGDWIDSSGKKVKNWKQKLITWDGRGQKKGIVPAKPRLTRQEEIEQHNLRCLAETFGYGEEFGNGF